MIKVGQRNNINLKKLIKQIKIKQANETTKYVSQNSTHSNVLEKDIWVSCSGQAKIGHQHSYHHLDKQDFIVF